jgi:hypothetical protein
MPCELANLILFAVSDEAIYINGAALVADNTTAIRAEASSFAAPKAAGNR